MGDVLFRGARERSRRFCPVVMGRTMSKQSEKDWERRLDERYPEDLEAVEISIDGMNSGVMEDTRQRRIMTIRSYSRFRAGKVEADTFGVFPRRVRVAGRHLSLL